MITNKQTNNIVEVNKYLFELGDFDWDFHKLLKLDPDRLIKILKDLNILEEINY